MRSYLQRVVICPNACYDVHISLSFTSIPPALIVTVVGVNKCKKSNDKPAAENRGCSKGQNQPAMEAKSDPIPTVLSVPKDTGLKSRCDDSVNDVINTFAQGNIESGFNKMSALSNPVGGYGDVPDLTQGPVNGNATLLAGFKAANVDDATAQAAIKKDPAAAAEYINAIKTGDQASLTEAAKKLDLNLNDNLSDIDQAAVKSATNPDNGSTPSYQGAPGTGNNTFGNGGQAPAQQGQCGVDDAFVGGLAKIESNCGRNTYSATTNVIGPYQYLCSTWQTYTARTGNSQYANCANAADPQIATKVTTDVANQIYRPEFENTIKQLGINEQSGLYMPHLLGEGGASKFFAAYQQYGGDMSADQLRSVLGNTAIDNNRSLFYAGLTPRTLDGVLAEVNKRMTGEGYVGGLASGGSPFSGNLSYYGGTPVTYGVGASPFGSVNPISYRTPYGYGSPTYIATPQPIASPVPTGIGTPSSVPLPTPPSTVQPGTTSAPPSAVPPQPAQTLIAQPASVPRGSPVMVSWSSVGMKANALCQVYAGSLSIAQSNNGSFSFDTSAIAHGSSVQFSLTCFSGIDGHTIQSFATSTVQ